ncbi:carbohydrate ABC transporter permease [Streptomyces sp. NPDC060194]|uniref:carbohydrate ABC transporter permease n=1 Tax=Streptomyces sp. NPDC060194 TaxID=3347069 RepID=UPI00364FDEE0
MNGLRLRNAPAPPAPPDRTPAPVAKAGRRTRKGPAASRDGARYALVFLAPWLIGVIGFTAGPMLYSLYLSFTDFDLLSSPRWAGLENYRFMFEEDRRFWPSLGATFTYTVVSVPLKLVFALLVAMFLNRGLKAIGIYRAVFYLPSLLGASVAVAVLWRQVFAGDGLVNQFLALVGIDGKSWISEPDYALWTLVLLAVWQFGSPMVIFLAGLKQIPKELYEAAEVDGASPLQRFRSVTLPLLTPLIFFNLVLQTITSFQSFTPAFVVSGGTGGPADSTLLLPLYLYQEAFTNFRMGYASGLAWILLLVIGAFTAAHFALAKYWVFYGDDRK